MKPTDIIKHNLTGALTSGSPQDQQAIIQAAAAVYGQAYNGARLLRINPVDARVEARAAAQDFINMRFERQ